ncbi:MAG: HlyD family efflux transporter periplasmic adaptor subunit [Coleofasciculaceae cyanobacterium]
MTSSNHSNTNSSNHRPTLQVVPPIVAKPTQLPNTSTPEINPNVTTKSSGFSLLRPLLMIGVIAGVGALGFMPVSTSVNGNAEVTSTEKARQSVTMPTSGRIELSVISNDTVKAGQIFGRVKSEEVDKNIAESTRIADQFQQDTDLTQSQISIAESNLKEALAKQEASRQNTSFVQQQLNQGNSLPQIQDLQSQQDSIGSEIFALESNFNLIKDRLNLYQEAFKSGGISHDKMKDLELQKTSLSQQIQGKQSLIRSKAAQIESVKQNLQQDIIQKQAEENQIVAAVQSAKQQIEQVKANVLIKQKVANKRAVELKKVQKRAEASELRAPISGTVITQNLDKKNNQYAQLGSPILEIVDLTKPMLSVQVKPEDIHLVRKGQIVTFRPQGRGLLSYTGTVEKISPVASSEGSQHPPMFTVDVTLNSTDNLSLQGLPGHAHIEVDSVLLYQKLQREFEKLVPIHKFF